jgi:hypothetical protein
LINLDLILPMIMGIILGLKVFGLLVV